MFSPSEQKPVHPTGRARSARPETTSGPCAGKSSTNLNTPRSGRTVPDGKLIVSQVSNIIKGTSALPGDKQFVKFHIKRRILPNSKEAVIVPIDEPNSARSQPRTTRAPLNSQSINDISRPGDASPSSRIIKENVATTVAIGGKTIEPKRFKKMVERPVEKEKQQRPLLEKPSQAAAVLPGPKFSANSGRSSSAPIASPLGRPGKQIPKQVVPKQDIETGPVRFTKPPFWDEQSRPPKGYEYSLPTRNFRPPRITTARPTTAATTTATKSSENKIAQTPRGSRSPSVSSEVSVARSTASSIARSNSACPVNNTRRLASSTQKPAAVAVSTGRRRSSSVSSNDSSNLNYMFSPNRLIARKKNESVVDECLLGRVNQSAPLKKTIIDHNGHCSKGFLDVNGRKRIHTTQPHEWQKYVPTLSNQKTNVFRYHPERDNKGKCPIGHERKTRSNEALLYGGNFDDKSTDVRDLRENPVGKHHQRSVRASSAPSVANRNNNNNKQTAAFGRTTSLLGSSVCSLEAPFDCSTNHGKYDITYESRTTCRPQSQQQHTRPVIRR